MNGALLKYFMETHNDTQKELAEALGVGLSTLNAKINGKADFTRKEIVNVKERYQLTVSEVDDIFFN